MGCLVETLAQALLPARCLLCRCSLSLKSAGGVCMACWSQLSPQEGERCSLCGELSRVSPCLQCLALPPPWQGLTALFTYEPPARDLVLMLKGGQDQLVQPLAERLWWQIQKANFPQPLTVTFVPMRPWRLLQRGYNQAELLARAVARKARWECQPLLARAVGGSQKRLSRSARRAQMVHAFSSVSKVPTRVLLVDDVVTTGATAAACCRALKRGGAKEVWVAAVAKTPRRG